MSNTYNYLVYPFFKIYYLYHFFSLFEYFYNIFIKNPIYGHNFSTMEITN